MILEFTDANGVAIPSGVLDIGMSNNIIIGLRVDGEGTPVTGNILRNTEKIGDFSWNSGVQLVNWYSGEGRPLYVNDGDKIIAQLVSPTGTNPTLTIKRFAPNIQNVVGMADFIDKTKGMVPGSNANNQIKNIINAISQETSVRYSKVPGENIRNIKNYVRNTTDLPPQNSFIYGDTSSLNDALASMKPPTTKDIFDTWARFSNNNYFPDPTNIPEDSEASKWYWDDALQSAVMPLNSSTFLGFVSDEMVDYYDHECLMQSTNADDDWNGLLLAYIYKDGISYSLSATACRDGRNGVGDEPAVNLNIRYNWGTIISGNNNNNERGGGWVGQRKWIKVSRRGDQFTVYFSRWNSDVYDPTLTMEVNLNDEPRFEIFKGPQRYGYCNISQSGSTFSKIKYFGGILRDTIIDAAKNEVYRYDTANGWQKLPGVKAQDIYGAPRVLTNPDTGKSYRLETNDTITAL